MKKTILILSPLDNTSPQYGLQIIGRNFNILGFDVVVLNVDNRDIKYRIFDIFDKKTILFCLSHNLRGWDIAFDSDNSKEFFYDYFDKWFVNIIDTPLNKVKRIKESGRKKLILSTDKSDIQIYKAICGHDVCVTHINNNSVFDHHELDGSDRVIKKMEERTVDVLFIGRLTSDRAAKRGYSADPKMENVQYSKPLFLEKAWASFVKGTLINKLKIRAKQCIKKCSPRYVRQTILQTFLFDRIVRIALTTNDRTIYEIAWDEIQKSHLLTKLFFHNQYQYDAEFLYWTWLIGHLVRTERRMRVFEEIVALPSHIKVRIVTNEPDAIEKRFGPNVECFPFQPWPEVTKMMANAKIVINTQFHVYASHERVSAAMANGAVIVSNENPYLCKRFTDNHDILFYDFRKGNLRKKLEEGLSDLNRLGNIAQVGMKDTLKNDMPIDLARQIINIVDQMSKL